MTPVWAPGDHLAHRFNPDLGIGRVTALEGRTLVVEFPTAGTTLRLAAGSFSWAFVTIDGQTLDRGTQAW